MATEFDADNVTAPRLVEMMKGPGGYGFNLHGEKAQNLQTISAVDEGSEALKGGLRVGDRVIEVNGVNVEKLNHGEVVGLIKKNPEKVVMLVVDITTEAYLRQANRPITADMANLQTVYEPKEAEEAKPVETVEEIAPQVQESSAELESTPTPTTLEESIASEQRTTTEEVPNNTENEAEASGQAEVVIDATTPEEVKQLNEVLDKEDAGETAPEPAPTQNGTDSHPPPVHEAEPTPEPTPAPAPAPEPTPAPVQPAAVLKPTKPSGRVQRKMIKEEKSSFKDKYDAFQRL